MAQSKDTGQEFHGLAEGWASEDRSPNRRQYQPKSPSCNREQRLPSSPHPAIATQHTSTCCPTFLTRKPNLSSAQIFAKAPSLQHLPTLDRLQIFLPKSLSSLSGPPSQPQSTPISHISCIPQLTGITTTPPGMTSKGNLSHQGQSKKPKSTSTQEYKLLLKVNNRYTRVNYTVTLWPTTTSFLNMKSCQK